MDSDQVRELALLCRLELRDDEVSRAEQQITRLLEYFTMLEDVDTTDCDASPYPRPIPLRTRPDQPAPPMPQAEVLTNAPEQRSGQFLVPRVVDG